ncbi:MAG: hypothetical protein K2X25_10885 [Caulobacteraceae bacterium]|nr:hypothetical protein [Caulobacteraceae bacterium]
MLKGAVVVGIMLAFAPVQTREVSGTDINGNVESAMRFLDRSAIGHCGLMNRESGYTASNVRCRVDPPMASGMVNAVCQATITCTNRPSSGPPPVPQARPA